ncbi:toxin [Usitatibacter palustris]|nr:toxin [Usitatibacter palustris]
MKAVFVELPAFARHRADYFDDSAFTRLQVELMKNPEGGDLIRDSGGLRKLRFPDARRGKGKRGGLRVIYYWWDSESQFWLFTVYDKDQADDLSPEQRRTLKGLMKAELEARSRR